MLWSDLREKPNEEARAARAMLHRAWWVLAAAALAAFLLIR
ncbi:morphogenic membrane protein MmpB [Streptomyces sp. 4N509B]